MTEATAIRQLRDYACEWGLQVRRVQLLKAYRAWWYLRVNEYRFEADTGDGKALVWVSRGDGVQSFDYHPSDPATFMLPLWAAFPLYNSVTMGWRQGSGERYKYRWHAFYRGLGSDERDAYKARFPPPVDERLWEDFYSYVADVPAGKTNPIADFIIGRV
jgi:hypothetical protein